MFIELLDVLRCPRPHEEVALIAAIDRVEGRYVAQALLGCPACGARYPVRDFVADFADGLAIESPALVRPARPTPLSPIDEDALMRLAALLGLESPGGYVLLEGDRAAQAAALAVGFDVQCVAVLPPHDVRPSDGVSVLRVGARLPFADGALRAAALDRAEAADVTRVVRARGRIVAPTDTLVPDGVTLLARDERDWVAEKAVPPGPTVTLGIRSRRDG